jgi:hypothetical protein
MFLAYRQAYAYVYARYDYTEREMESIAIGFASCCAIIITCPYITLLVTDNLTSRFT